MTQEYFNRPLIVVQRADDESKSRQELLSEVIAYRQWCAGLESEANAGKLAAGRADEYSLLIDKLIRVGPAMVLFNKEKVFRANEAFADLLNLDLASLLSKKPVELFDEKSYHSVTNQKEDGEIEIELLTGHRLALRLIHVVYQGGPAWGLIQ